MQRKCNEVRMHSPCTAHLGAANAFLKYVCQCVIMLFYALPEDMRCNALYKYATKCAVAEMQQEQCNRPIENASFAACKIMQKTCLLMHCVCIVYAL